MGIKDLFGGVDLDQAARPLTSTELNALDQLIVERGERSISDTPFAILAKPEEAIRQLWVDRLVRHYGYPISRIAVEYPITFGRDSSKRADIVVFDADRPTLPYG